MKAWKLFILFVGVGVLAGATVTTFQHFAAESLTSVLSCRPNACIRKGGNGWCKQEGKACRDASTKPCFECVTAVSSAAACNVVLDGVCPATCAAGADYDCCIAKGRLWITGRGCFVRQSSSSFPPAETDCSATSDSLCPPWCTALTDYDCCVGVPTRAWVPGTGCVGPSSSSESGA